MKISKFRTLIAAIIFIVLCIGLIAGVSFGTLSGFGWDTIAMLCPLGALTSMIAAKMLVPRALISLAIAIIVILILGRVFCGWVCPVPVLDRLRNFFRSPKSRKKIEQERHDEAMAIAQHACTGCGGACKHNHKKLDSRHAILGGALLSTAIFGFPVFCIVCPVGLSFATIFLVWRVFAMGDVTIAAVLVPVMLFVEVVFLRKWCSRFCPLSALMNLVGRLNRTWRPVIDDSKCIETSKGTACSKCAIACDEDINLRHLEYGEHGLDDCTRCRACVDACPAHAITLPFLPKKAKEGEPILIGEESSES